MRDITALQQTTRALIRSPRRRGREAWAALEAERLRGLKVDDERVFVRSLHRQVAGLRTLKDAIDVSC